MSQQQLDSLLQMMKAQPVIQGATVQQQRAGFEQMGAMFPVDADIKREPVTANGVKSEWVSAPDADPGRAILYLHGGGYVIGFDQHPSRLSGSLVACGQGSRAGDRLSPRTRASISRRGR